MDESYLVLLDRDGTINRDVGYPGRNHRWWHEIELLPGVVEGIKMLRSNSRVKLGVISNQAGVARGYFGTDRVEEVNNLVNRMLEDSGAGIEVWEYCPFVDMGYAMKKGVKIEENKWVRHDNGDRKPGLGMVEKVSEKYGLRWENLVNNRRIYVIGDKGSDVKTGLNANGIGIFVGKSLEELDKVKKMQKEYGSRVRIAKDLVEAAEIVLAEID
jgi:D-glycero-D-manno-heptose 1,7-bisphosphate phosphatase